MPITETKDKLVDVKSTENATPDETKEVAPTAEVKEEVSGTVTEEKKELVVPKPEKTEEVKVEEPKKEAIKETPKVEEPKKEEVSTEEKTEKKADDKIEIVAPAVEVKKERVNKESKEVKAEEPKKEIKETKKEEKPVAVIPDQNKNYNPIVATFWMGSFLFWFCGGILAVAAALTIGLLILSSWYKSQINSMKQAPFNVPNWAPTWLFPRDYSFYYEYEITIRDKLDDMEHDNNRELN